MIRRSCVPVKTTIAECYRFVYAQYLTLLGVLWLPLLIYLAASFLLLRGLTAHFSAEAP